MYEAASNMVTVVDDGTIRGETVSLFGPRGGSDVDGAMGNARRRRQWSGTEPRPGTPVSTRVSASPRTVQMTAVFASRSLARTSFFPAIALAIRLNVVG